MMTDPVETRPPLPPFTAETAVEKVRKAEDAWNTRDPAHVALAYTPDSQWRNRVEFFSGRDAIQAFLARKWAGELGYRLIKELWCFRDNRMAVRFAYEWHDAAGAWFRSYGNELWEFDPHGLMRRRVASINDLPIAETDRLFHWPQGPPPGRSSRPHRAGFMTRAELSSAGATTRIWPQAWAIVGSAPSGDCGIMTEADALPLGRRNGRPLHPWPVRVMHWVNAAAMLIMITSGWGIYDDDVVVKGLHFS